MDEQSKPRLSSHIYDSTVEQCFLNLPEDMVEDNPLDLENIKERQDHDEKLMQSAVKYPECQLKGSWGRRSIAVAGEVTQHGQAHLNSWSVTIVSLKV